MMFSCCRAICDCCDKLKDNSGSQPHEDPSSGAEGEGETNQPKPPDKEKPLDEGPTEVPPQPDLNPPTIEIPLEDTDSESSETPSGTEVPSVKPSGDKPFDPMDFLPPFVPGGSDNSGIPNDHPMSNKVKLLFSRTNYFLAVTPEEIKGIHDREDKYALLEVTSHADGEVRIKGVESGVFIAMDENGKVYPQPDANSEDTIFKEMYGGQDHWNRYLSKKNLSDGKQWFLAIKKSGAMKRGPKTAFHQKSAQFLPTKRPN